MKKRVVVTGMGAMTPLGLDLATFQANLKAGVSAARNITAFDTSRFPVRRACPIQGFNPHKYRTHVLDPFIQYAVAAATEAIQDAAYEIEKADPYRVGISVSSSKGGMHTLSRLATRFYAKPSALLGARLYANLVPNFAAQWIARRWKIKGPAKCYVAACATGTVAVAEGACMIREGLVDACLAGASDASIVPLMLAGYHQMGVLTRESMRPYDRRRQGFLVGEGAGIVLMENLEIARARGAKIYGEILGASYGSDGMDTLQFEDELGLAVVLENLMSRSDLALEDIDYVNLHGTGTPAGDLYETRQLKRFFGKKAYHIPTSSIKSMTGHLLGASGAVEIIASLLAMQGDFIPPTLGLEEPDPECDLDYTAGKFRDKKLRTVISLSMGFGGHLAAIALRKI